MARQSDSPNARSDRLRLSALPGSAPTAFALQPDAETRHALAGELGLAKLPKLRFEGRLHPEGRGDWRLEGELGATVVQPCAVTLEPVTTRIDVPVTRRYLADWQEPAPGTEIEMPEDDTAEPAPEVVDLAAVMAEALSLAIPDFPRAEGAALGEQAATPPGAAPIAEEETKPFAGLAALRDRLADDD
jgi:uncharacterized metal-binding protein YceD (DUF177 family)